MVVGFVFAGLSCTSNSEFFWVHTDPLGTPLLVTNTVAETSPVGVVWKARYEGFGKATLTHPTTTGYGNLVLDTRFPGQIFDAETGYHYNYFRTYDPSTGRYLEADPIGQSGGINVYSYAMGNPANAIDPDGLSSIVFNRDAGTITLHRNDGSVVGTWPANNNVTNSAKGDWPACDPCQYSHYNRHPSSGPNDAYGSHGIFVFHVSGRSGMGVHSGRANRAGPDQPTLGCIRTTDDAMKAISDTHFGGPDPTLPMSRPPDPLTHISVPPGGQSSLPKRR
jgi:RHS repeat-associated protein